jgi:hypothetical protein
LRGRPGQALPSLNRLIRTRTRGPGAAKGSGRRSTQRSSPNSRRPLGAISSKTWHRPWYLHLQSCVGGLVKGPNGKCRLIWRSVNSVG